MLQEEIERLITSEYLTAQDKEAVEKCVGCDKTQAKHFIISFRRCGGATLDRLSKGAGAKPHDILEKTIKDKSQLFKDESQLSNVDVFFEKIRGFVGHWENNEFLGIYLTDHGAGEYRLKFPKHTQDIGEIHGLKKRYFLNLKNDVEAIDRIRDISNWESLLFTGDYDLHDCMQLAGKWQYLIEDDASNDYKNLIDGLNAEIKEKNPLLIKQDDYNRIQHGAQFGYISHMINNEYSEKDGMLLYEAVIDASFPIAVCNGKTKPYWTIIGSKGDYKEYVEKLGLAPKEIWVNENEYKKFIAEFGKVFPKITFIPVKK